MKPTKPANLSGDELALCATIARILARLMQAGEQAKA